jgi:hypothetical protein
MSTRPSLATRRNERSAWQISICLLLALFLLYNPFLFLAHTGNGLSVQHPVSKRATVAASELSHFPPVSERMAPNALPTEAIGEHCTTLKEAFQSQTDVDTDRLTAAELSANLWFRPPPIA